MSAWEHISQGLGEAWDSLADGWRRLFRRAGRALTRFSPGGEASGGRSGLEEASWRSAGWGLLAGEVFDDGDRVVVRLEAPGMEKDDFEVEVVGGYLVVRGEKQLARERTVGSYTLSECAYGSFERAVPLPAEVDSARASASYRRGVLRVELPKAAPGRRRALAIR